MANAALGYIAAAIAVVCFGSNFVPVKQFDTGDGLFFQWVLCTAIFFAGLVVNLIRESPKFEWFAMVGGVLWATGNVLTVPTIKLVGLGLGLLVWGLANMLMGWSTGTFGLWGLNVKAPEGAVAEALNYIGAAVACASMIPYVFVKPDTVLRDDDLAAEEADSLTTPLAAEGHRVSSDRTGSDNEGGPVIQLLSRLYAGMSDAQRRLLGIVFAIISGLLYGNNFTPPQYLMDHCKGSQEGLDYVFSHFCGIFAASTFWFLLYCALYKNKPKVYPSAILPGIVSGLGWAVAEIMWFVANQNLSFTVSFPIVCTGPGVVASLWGILLFREITSRKSLIMVGVAFALTVVGIIIITISHSIGKQREYSCP